MNPETPSVLQWQLIEITEGEQATLPCISKTADGLQSSKAKWFKVKEREGGFDVKELKPATRKQTKREKEAAPGRVYWASDSDWSIHIDSVELDDASLYQCDIKVGSVEVKQLVELIVECKWSHVHSSTFLSIILYTLLLINNQKTLIASLFIKIKCTPRQLPHPLAA